MNKVQKACGKPWYGSTVPLMCQRKAGHFGWCKMWTDDGQEIRLCEHWTRTAAKWLVRKLAGIIARAAK